MKVAGIAFDEEVISLNAADFKARLLKVSGTGKVPTLIDGDVQVWESLAILEYLAEKFPAASCGRPIRRRARMRARFRDEMHAGFVPLRRACPMNMWRPVKKRELDDDVAANVRRIDAMWTDCRAASGQAGRFCSERSAPPTRCMRRSCRAFTPTGSRSARRHATIWKRSWRCRPGPNGTPPALKEPWVLPEDELDWPTVLRV